MQKSTSTLSLQVQSLIARALDEDNYALITSIDRLRLIGLPVDLVDLIEVWLRDQYFYYNVSDHNSYLNQINSGTMQGSNLGPIYSPSCDQCQLHWNKIQK